MGKQSWDGNSEVFLWEAERNNRAPNTAPPFFLLEGTHPQGREPAESRVDLQSGLEVKSWSFQFWQVSSLERLRSHVGWARVSASLAAPGAPIACQVLSMTLEPWVSMINTRFVQQVEAETLGTEGAANQTQLIS